MVGLTREEAISIFREMYGDMKEFCGDDANIERRLWFREKWCKERFPNETIECNCPLCHYVHCTAALKGTIPSCKNCPIEWDTTNGACTGARKNGANKRESAFLRAPVSWILSQQEKEVEDEG